MIPEQTIDSAKTSVNQLPFLHKKVADSLDGCFVLDYGCGKYSKGLDYLEGVSDGCVGYDPYNQPEEVNYWAMKYLGEGSVDIVVCSNVLNVVKEYDIRASIIEDCSKASLKAFFSVYEGDKKKVGRQTTKGWQENRPTEDYIHEIEEHFSFVERKGKVITAWP